MVESHRDFYTTLAFDAPVTELPAPRRNIAITLSMDILELCGYPMVKTSDDMFSRFDPIPACDGQTDGWTEGHLATA